jgi:hypothetical protein
VIFKHQFRSAAKPYDISVFQTRCHITETIYTETDTLSVSSEILIDHAEPAQKDYDGLIMLSYVIFSIIFLGVIYAASMSPGTVSGDLASMPVFP